MEDIEMSVRKVLLVLSLVGVTLAATACRPNIVGTDAGVYSAGTLYAVLNQDLDTAYQATVKAMEDLELRIRDKAKDVFSAKVLAEGADGKKATVILKPRPDGDIDLRIAVGLANQQRSVVIYDQIKKNLGMPAK